MTRICVFCGSATGSDPDVAANARALGRLLAERGIGLVYGGASIGLMGTVADACLDAGGEVTGIIPKTLLKREVAHTGLTKLVVVESMHNRKAMMAALSDAFITLPGGFGTFEEVLEMITWNQLGIVKKPIILVNVNGFYDGLDAFIRQAARAGYIRESALALYELVPDAGYAMERLSKS
jgi:uncharacterized protein (TIGR00730 family)